MWASGVTFMRTRKTNGRTKGQFSQRLQCSEFDRNWSRKLIIIWSNKLARKCEQAWQSSEQDKPMHVRRCSIVNDVSAPSSFGIEPVSWSESVQIEWQGNVSKRDFHANKRQTNARTERQNNQQSKSSEFAGNWTRELILIWSSRMARKCEQAWHSCQQDKSIHVRSDRWVNDVSVTSSLGIEPVSWLFSDQTEGQGHVSKRDFHANETNQCTYGATVQPMTSILRVRSELTPLVHYHLIEQKGKEMWAIVTFMRTSQTNLRTEVQFSQRHQFPELARNWPN
jgi:hypothetical protein